MTTVHVHVRGRRRWRVSACASRVRCSHEPTTSHRPRSPGAARRCPGGDSGRRSPDLVVENFTSVKVWPGPGNMTSDVPPDLAPGTGSASWRVSVHKHSCVLCASRRVAAMLDTGVSIHSAQSVPRRARRARLGVGARLGVDGSSRASGASALPRASVHTTSTCSGHCPCAVWTAHQSQSQSQQSIDGRVSSI